MADTILDPEAVEKLVRHLSKTLKVRVIMDYAPAAVPRTAADGTVWIPAFNSADELYEMLGSIVHESGHVEFDESHNQEFDRIYGEPRWLQVPKNIIADARIDRRRCDELAGVRSIYSNCWKLFDAMIKKRGAPVDIRTICQGAMDQHLGFTDVAPTAVEVAEKFSSHPEAVEVMHKAYKSDGPLVYETFKFLEVYGRDEHLPVPQQPKNPQTGERMPVPTKDELVVARKVMAEGLATMESFKDEGRHIEILRSNKVRRAADVLARRVFGDWEMPQELVTTSGGGNGQAGGSSAGKSCSVGINPILRADAPRKTTQKDVEAYQTDMFQTAVRAFVETAEQREAIEEDPYFLDMNGLHRFLTDPMSLLIGDEVYTEQKTVVDVILDTSGSMECGVGDGKTTRLGVASAGLRLWIEACNALSVKGLRMGLLLFSCEPTRAVKFEDVDLINPRQYTTEKIRELDPGGGTNLKRAFVQSLKDLDEENAKKKAVICISDGDVLEDAIEYAKKEWPSEVPLAILTIGEDIDEGQQSDSNLFRFRVPRVDVMPVIFARTLKKAMGG